jgi:hypothetical protein
MQDIDGCPLVDVRQRPFAFILDTGARSTVVAADLIAELGPSGFGIRELRLSDGVINDLPADTFPGLRGLGGNHPPRGVLSAAAFPGNLLTLDYPVRKITLRAGELPAPDQRRIFEYDDRDPLPLVLIQLPGRVHKVHARTVAGEFTLMSAPVDGAILLGELRSICRASS